jgi:hypothetical protein
MDVYGHLNLSCPCRSFRTLLRRRSISFNYQIRQHGCDLVRIAQRHHRHYPELERKEELLKRIREAARFLPLEPLAISPQSGFASTMEGNLLTEEEQWAKLQLVVDVARKVWG